MWQVDWLHGRWYRVFITCIPPQNRAKERELKEKLHNKKQTSPLYFWRLALLFFVSPRLRYSSGDSCFICFLFLLFCLLLPSVSGMYIDCWRWTYIIIHAFNTTSDTLIQESKSKIKHIKNKWMMYENLMKNMNKPSRKSIIKEREALS